VLDGLTPFLIGVRCLLNHRDYLQRADGPLPTIDAAISAKWQKRIRDGIVFSEATATELLTECGMPMNSFRSANSEETAIAAFRHFGCPVVMKTAHPHVQHKSDMGGVVLNITSEADCITTYRQLSNQFGPEVLVAPMISAQGIEMILGVVNDEQLGPMVMMGFGGIHAEILRDVQFAMAPFDVATARRLVDKLRMRPLLDGVRGGGAVDIDSYCDAAARLSVLADQLRGDIAEIDINPIMIHANGCVAVDALIQPTIPRKMKQ
jgi:succinyl-CoA synthetase beta subunit